MTARDQVQKRLVYETLSNDSGKLYRSAVSHRGSIPQQSTTPTASSHYNTQKLAASRRPRSTRTGATNSTHPKTSVAKTVGSIALKSQSVLDQRRQTTGRLTTTANSRNQAGAVSKLGAPSHYRTITPRVMPASSKPTK